MSNSVKNAALGVLAVLVAAMVVMALRNGNSVQAGVPAPVPTVSPTQEPPLVAVAGDSYVAATGATSTGHGYVADLQPLLHASTTAIGYGGAGFTNKGVAGVTYFAGLTELAGLTPALVIVQGSGNDRYASRTTLLAATERYLRRAERLDPSARFALLGPIYNSDATGLAMVRDVTRQAASALNVPYIDPTGWLTGQPRLMATGKYVGHPNDAGHERIAERLAAAIRAQHLLPT